MGSGSSRPQRPARAAPSHLTPRAAHIRYPGYRAQPVFPRSACVALGNPYLADRHPDRLALLMQYDTRFAWRDMEVKEYRSKLRNVFPGDAEVLRWVNSYACQCRLMRGRDYIDRRRRNHGAGTAIPFLGDPMYGIYVDAGKVLRNLEGVIGKNGFKVLPKQR